MQQAREEESRKKATSHFQFTLNEIPAQLEQHEIYNTKIWLQNSKLGELKKLIEECSVREEHIDKLFKHKELQQQVVETKLQQTTQLLKDSDKKHQREREFLEDSRHIQKQMKILQKKQAQIMKEKVHLQSEHSKAVLSRRKLESLCRELQHHNRTLKEENMQQAREGESSKKATSHFQFTLNGIQAQLEQHELHNAKLEQESSELGEKLKKLMEQYTLRKEMLKKIKELKQEMRVGRTKRKSSSNTVLLQMAEEKTIRDKENKSSHMKLERLEKLFRALQMERNGLHEKVEVLKEQVSVPAANVNSATPVMKPCTALDSQKELSTSSRRPPGVYLQGEPKGVKGTKPSSKDPFHMISSGH